MTDQPSRRKRGRPPHPDILTPREWQVLDLLRQNLTNEQIAHRLDISPATAKYHVSQIISKLGVETREQAAAWQPEAGPERGWWQRAFALLARPAIIGAAIVAVGAVAFIALGALPDGGEGVGDASDAVEQQLCAPASPHIKSPLGLTRTRATFCWADVVDGEARLDLSGYVDYWPDCDGFAEGLDPLRIEFAESLPAGATSFQLPPTTDPRFPHPKEGQITVQARGSTGSQLLSDGQAWIGEIDYSTCPPVSSLLSDGFTITGAISTEISWSADLPPNCYEFSDVTGAPAFFFGVVSPKDYQVYISIQQFTGPGSYNAAAPPAGGPGQFGWGNSALHVFKLGNDQRERWTATAGDFVVDRSFEGAAKGSLKADLQPAGPDAGGPIHITGSWTCRHSGD